MSILKQYTNSQGITLGYHRVVQVIVDKDGVKANVHSWPTSEQYQANVDTGLPRGQTYVNVPSISSLAEAEAFLVSDSGSPFFGGEVEVEQTTVELARANKLRTLLIQRDNLEFAGVNVPDVGVVGTDAASQRLLTGSAVLALLAMGQGAPFQVEWTLKDGVNSVTLSANDVAALSVAVGVYVSQVYVAHRAAVAAVAAASTVEDVNAVQISLS